MAVSWPQVMLVRVFDPTGSEVKAHTRTALVRNGATQLTIPLALDAAPGRWTATVRDAATGVMGKASFSVKERGAR